MIIYQIIFILLIFFTVLYDKNRNKYIIVIATFAILFLLAALRGEFVDHDYGTYKKYYNQLLYSRINIEYSFKIISKFAYEIFNNFHVVIILYSFLSLIIIFKAILNLSPNFALSILLFYSSLFFIQHMNQIRCGLSVSVFLLSIKYINEKNALKYFSLFAVSVFFHYSSIIIFPLYFINTKTYKPLIYIIAIVFTYIIVYNVNIINLISNLNIPYISNKIEIYTQLQRINKIKPVNIFNTVQLLRIAIFIFLSSKYIIYRNNNRNNNEILLLKIYFWGIITFVIFSNTPVFAFRISQVYLIVEIIILTHLLYYIKPHYFSKILLILIAIVYFFIEIYYNKIVFDYNLII